MVSPVNDFFFLPQLGRLLYSWIEKGVEGAKQPHTEAVTPNLIVTPLYHCAACFQKMNANGCVLKIFLLIFLFNMGVISTPHPHPPPPGVFGSNNTQGHNWFMICIFSEDNKKCFTFGFAHWRESVCTCFCMCVYMFLYACACICMLARVHVWMFWFCQMNDLQRRSFDAKEPQPFSFCLLHQKIKGSWLL